MTKFIDLEKRRAAKNNAALRQAWNRSTAIVTGGHFTSAEALQVLALVAQIAQVVQRMADRVKAERAD